MKKIVLSVFAFFASVAPALAEASLASATLPGSRRAVVNDTVTIFATLVNSGTEALTQCRPQMPEGVTDIGFAYQRTDPQTNAIVGSPNTPVDLAVGASQSFVLSFTPTAEFDARAIALNHSCDQASAPQLPGVNDVILTASTTPGPDIIAIAVTPSGDGAARLRADNNRGAIAIAAVNIGAGIAETRLQSNAASRNPQDQWLAPQISALDGDTTVSFCQTDAVGTCQTDREARLNADIGATAATFTAFVAGPSDRGLPFRPDMLRLPIAFVERDEERLFGAASVAVASSGTSAPEPESFDTGLYSAQGLLQDDAAGEAVPQRVDVLVRQGDPDWSFVFVRRAIDCGENGCAPRQQTGYATGPCLQGPGGRLRCDITGSSFSTNMTGNPSGVISGRLVLDYGNRPDSSGSTVMPGLLLQTQQFQSPFNLASVAYRPTGDAATNMAGTFRVMLDADVLAGPASDSTEFELQPDGSFVLTWNGCVAQGQLSFPTASDGNPLGYGMATGVALTQAGCPLTGSDRTLYLLPDQVDGNGKFQALRLVILAADGQSGTSVGLIRRRQLRLATWNIELLAEANNAGCIPRQDADYLELRDYANQIGADVIAFQEIENSGAAARVFDPDVFDLHISSRPDAPPGSDCRDRPGEPFPNIRTGFAVRRGIAFDPQPDFSDLAVTAFNRHGTDIEIVEGTSPIRLMSVHLRSGCFFGTSSSACSTLFTQTDLLETWMEARYNDGTSFGVLGDFNRRLGQSGDEVWARWNDNIPTGFQLTNANGGAISNCLARFPDYIDHLIFGPQAAGLIDPGSFLEFLYDGNEANHPSDHCPSLVTVFVD